MHPNITIAENWQRTNWNNWSTVNNYTSTLYLGNLPTSDLPYSLSTQDHVDLRTFTAIENWIPASSVSYNPLIKNYPVLETTITTLPTQLVSNYQPIDITPIANGLLTLSFPSYTSALSLGNSTITLGDSNSNYATLSFEQGTLTQEGTTAYIQWLISEITGIDLQSITHVGFILQATNEAVIYLAALRVLSPQWVWTVLDFDSINNQLRNVPPLLYDVPTATNTTLPQIIRTAVPEGADDPQPKYQTINILFNSGSQISGPNLLQFQTNINNSGHFEFEVEWGSTAANLLTLSNTYQGTTYSQQTNAILTNNTLYQLSCTVNKSELSVAINPIGTNSIEPAIAQINMNYANEQTVQRGRLGLLVSLSDNDAYIGDIRPQSLVFAEYISKPFISRTPVKGVQIFANYSSNKELFTNQWSPFSSSTALPLLSQDHSQTLTTYSTKVQIIDTSSSYIYPSPTLLPSPNLYPQGNFQGIVSQPLLEVNDPVSGISDFNNLLIKFAIWSPFSFIDQEEPTFQGYLIGKYQTIPLNIFISQPNQWNFFSYTFYGQEANYINGIYQLAIYANADVAYTWWIDAISVSQYTISWGATNDPLVAFTNANSIMNNPNSGIVFMQPGNQLQVRAQALTQDAFITDQIRIVPKYQTLGCVTPSALNTLANNI